MGPRNATSPASWVPATVLGTAGVAVVAVAAFRELVEVVECGRVPSDADDPHPAGIPATLAIIAAAPSAWRHRARVPTTRTVLLTGGPHIGSSPMSMVSPS